MSIRKHRNTVIIIVFQQGKPKNLWTLWQNRTSLEKILIGLCVFNCLLFMIMYLNPMSSEQCNTVVYPTVPAYEESDSYANTGQGEIADFE